MTERRRKRLVAGLGVAAMSYVIGVACDTGSPAAPTLGGTSPPLPASDATVDQGVVSIDAGPDADATTDADADAATDADADAS